MRNQRFRQLGALFAGVVYLAVVATIDLAHSYVPHGGDRAGASPGYAGACSCQRGAGHSPAHSDGHCPACRFLKQNDCTGVSPVVFPIRFEIARVFSLLNAAPAEECPPDVVRSRAPPSILL